MATILYARVSTSEQTIEHQQTQAEAAGFVLDEVIVDDGVSGVNTRLQDRPQGRRLFDLLRAGDTLVVRWIDRLGRNYDDVTTNIKLFISRGVIVRTVMNGMVFDGTVTDPTQKAVRDALIAFMAAMAQAQAEATKDAQKAGIAHARAKIAAGEEDGTGKAYLGRKPTYNAAQVARVQELCAAGTGATKIAQDVGLSRSTVNRIISDPAAAIANVNRWGH